MQDNILINEIIDRASSEEGRQIADETLARLRSEGLPEDKRFVGSPVNLSHKCRKKLI